MSKGKVALLGVVAGLFAIYVAAAPYITVHKMQAAAESHDGEALSEHIEFPSVRQSLKDQMNVRFAKEMAEDQGMNGSPFAAFGAVLAGAMVDKLVDAYVTPAGFSQVMAGEKLSPHAGQGEEGSSSSDRKPLADASMSYESLDKFVVRVKYNDGGEGKLVLRRRGLGWKLTDVIVPLD